MPQARNRAWCFTSFNTTTTPHWDEKTMQWLVYQLEIAPTTKKEHWQGFVYYKDAKTMKSSQILLHCQGSHHEVKAANSSFQDQKNYCSKDSDRKQNTHPSEFGTIPTQGARTDLTLLIKDVAHGLLSKETIIMDTPMKYHQYGRTLDKAYEIVDRRRACPLPRKIIFLAHDEEPEVKEEVFTRFNDDGMYWEGYNDEKIILFEDIEYNDAFIKKWEKHQILVPIRYGTKRIMAHTIYIRRISTCSLRDGRDRLVVTAPFSNTGSIRSNPPGNRTPDEEKVRLSLLAKGKAILEGTYVRGQKF